MAAAVPLCSTGASHYLLAIALCICVFLCWPHIWFGEYISFLYSFVLRFGVYQLLLCLGKVVCLSTRRRLCKHSFCIHHSFCHLAVYHHRTDSEPVWWPGQPVSGIILKNTCWLWGFGGLIACSPWLHWNSWNCSCTMLSCCNCWGAGQFGSRSWKISSITAAGFGVGDGYWIAIKYAFSDPSRDLKCEWCNYVTRAY